MLVPKSTAFRDRTARISVRPVGGRRPQASSSPKVSWPRVSQRLLVCPRRVLHLDTKNRKNDRRQGPGLQTTLKVVRARPPMLARYDGRRNGRLMANGRRPRFCPWVWLVLRGINWRKRGLDHAIDETRELRPNAVGLRIARKDRVGGVDARSPRTVPVMNAVFIVRKRRGFGRRRRTRHTSRDLRLGGAGVRNFDSSRRRRLGEKRQLVDFRFRGCGARPVSMSGKERLPPGEAPGPFRDQIVQVLVDASYVGRIDDDCGRLRSRGREAVVDVDIDLINSREIGDPLEASRSIDVDPNRNARRQNDCVFGKRTHTKSVQYRGRH